MKISKQYLILIIITFLGLGFFCGGSVFGQTDFERSEMECKVNGYMKVGEFTRKLNNILKGSDNAQKIKQLDVLKNEAMNASGTYSRCVKDFAMHMNVLQRNIEEIKSHPEMYPPMKGIGDRMKVIEGLKQKVSGGQTLSAEELKKAHDQLDLIMKDMNGWIETHGPARQAI